MQKKLKDLTLKNETKFEDDDHSRVKATFEKPRKSDSSQILNQTIKGIWLFANFYYNI